MKVVFMKKRKQSCCLNKEFKKETQMTRCNLAHIWVATGVRLPMAMRFRMAGWAAEKQIGFMKSFKGLTSTPDYCTYATAYKSWRRPLDSALVKELLLYV
jgi:hypothetical protein